MNYTARISGYDGQTLTVVPSQPIDRELLQKQPNEIIFKLNDGRTISDIQCMKAHAIINDIAFYHGNLPEIEKAFLKFEFCGIYDVPYFSLSDCDMTTAREFISYLIDFCLTWSVPTRRPLSENSDDIGRYLYMCLEHRKCAVCNKPAEVHHVDRIGMGFDREKVVHIGLNAIALCRGHHEEAHAGEKALFEKNFIYGIKLDKYLCDLLSLNTKERWRLIGSSN